MPPLARLSPRSGSPRHCYTMRTRAPACRSTVTGTTSSTPTKPATAIIAAGSPSTPTPIRRPRPRATTATRCPPTARSASSTISATLQPCVCPATGTIRTRGWSTTRARCGISAILAFRQNPPTTRPSTSTSGRPTTGPTSTSTARRSVRTRAASTPSTSS